MLNDLRRIGGYISVIENGNSIVISGAPTYLIDLDIKNHWNTRKIQIHMFKQMSRSKIVIDTFFALEFEYMIRTIVENQKTYTNKLILKSLLEELRTNTWLKNINKEHEVPYDFKQLSQLNIKLLDHQIKYLCWAGFVKPRYNLRGTLLAAAAGAGKTVTGISVALVNNASKVIVVSPKNAVYDAWEDDIVDKMKDKQKIWIADRDVDFDPKAKWFIVHYEALGKIMNEINTFKNERVVIILDESHNFNDPMSLRTALFLELCKRVNPVDIVWSSGTPIKAMGSDAIPLFRCIDPLFTSSVEMRMKKIFGKDASKANDVLANRLAMVSYKVPKEMFMKTEPIIEEIPVALPNGEDYTLDRIKTKMVLFIEERTKYYEARRPKDEEFYKKCLTIFSASIGSDAKLRSDFDTYNHYVNTFIKSGFDSRTMGAMAVFCNAFEKEQIIPRLDKELRNEFKDVKSVIKYTSLKIRGECLGRVLEKERKNAHLDMAKHYDLFELVNVAKKKTIIFTSYVEIVDTVYDRFAKAKYKPLKVTAETNKNLTSIISQFDKDAKSNPLAATYQSLSTAVRLTMANNIITVNSPYRDHIMTQAIARAWRIGQDEQVFVWHMVLDTGDVPNISTRTNDILKWSKEQVDQIMGFKSDMDLDTVFSMESLDDGIESYVPGTTNISTSNITMFALMYQDMLEKSL